MAQSGAAVRDQESAAVSDSDGYYMAAGVPDAFARLWEGPVLSA